MENEKGWVRVYYSYYGILLKNKLKYGVAEESIHNINMSFFDIKKGIKAWIKNSEYLRIIDIENVEIFSKSNYKLTKKQIHDIKKRIYKHN